MNSNNKYYMMLDMINNFYVTTEEMRKNDLQIHSTIWA